MVMRLGQLRAWLWSLAAGERDAAVEALLGIAPPVDPIVEALTQARVGPDDVVIDLGAGLGKVVLLAYLLTGATARGIEVQEVLVHRARSAAARLGLSQRGKTDM